MTVGVVNSVSETKKLRINALHLCFETGLLIYCNQYFSSISSQVPIIKSSACRSRFLSFPTRRRTPLTPLPQRRRPHGLFPSPRDRRPPPQQPHTIAPFRPLLRPPSPDAASPIRRCCLLLFLPSRRSKALHRRRRIPRRKCQKSKSGASSLSRVS